MKRHVFTLLAFAVLAILVSSCLTVGKKEYTFTLTGKNSGTLTMKFINIMSIKDDSTDVSNEDFEELLTSYLNGDQIEKDYPTATNIQKKLFEENGQLCAIVSMDFPDLATARLYQRDKKSPYMLCIKSALDSESYLDSNGEYGGEIMPVVFWEPKLTKLTLSTEVTQSEENTVSLLGKYRKWKKDAGN